MRIGDNWQEVDTKSRYVTENSIRKVYIKSKSVQSVRYIVQNVRLSVQVIRLHTLAAAAAVAE